MIFIKHCQLVAYFAVLLRHLVYCK